MRVPITIFSGENVTFGSRGCRSPYRLYRRDSPHIRDAAPLVAINASFPSMVHISVMIHR